MDWLCGFMTWASMFLVSRKRWEGWAVGLCSEVVWGVLIYQRELWGLVPLNLVLFWTYTNALIEWRAEAAIAEQPRTVIGCGPSLQAYNLEGSTKATREVLHHPNNLDPDHARERGPMGAD